MEGLIKSVEGRLEQVRNDIRYWIIIKLNSNKVYELKDLIIKDKVINSICFVYGEECSSVRLYYTKKCDCFYLSEITNIQSLLKIAKAIKDL